MSRAREQDQGTPWLIRVPFALAAAGLLINVGWAISGDPQGDGTLIDGIYDATVLMGALACLGRAYLSASVRAAWIAFAIGLFGWAAGDVYWTATWGNSLDAPYPSLADLGYLTAPISFFIGIAILIRERVGGHTSASISDAAIGALGAAAIGTAILTPALTTLATGDPAAVLTNVAYPVADVALLAMVAGSLALGRLREARSMLLVGAGLLVWAGADLDYLFLEATSAYQPGWIDIAWLLGAVLVGSGALISPVAPVTAAQAAYRSSLALPGFFALLAIAVLIWDHFHPLGASSIWLAGATVIAVVARLATSFRENDRLVRTLHEDSVTDALTGLGNRRSLLGALELALRHDDECLFALFDLDGFKTYNDNFGHPAGDALLRRFGGNLAASVASRGSAYRLGGDEFCILVEAGARRPEAIVEAARQALHDEGEGFSIGASGGWVLLGGEVSDPEEALRAADQRMYVEKAQRSRASLLQTQEVLKRIFWEREPALGEHGEGVARLADAIGRRLGLDAESQDALTRAAELHDVGKIAIPEEILHKPGPLDEGEWDLMRRHPLIGDRILGATPAMKPVARLVRSSHERWDGSGYPEGLRGEEIPLGARIICICDSFNAMTTERAFQRAVSRGEALEELRRCAAAQFDPDLVAVLCEIVEGEFDRAPATTIAIEQ